MKAKLIAERVCVGYPAIYHDSGLELIRILIPEKNNLVITLYEKSLDILDGFKETQDCIMIKETEIPDDLIEKAVNLMESKNFLLEKLKKLIEQHLFL